MIKQYTKEDQQKYCAGFKKCTLPITDYAEKMNINVEDLKKWLKEYKEPLPYGAINLTKLIEQPKEPTKGIYVKFTTDAINVELKENYDKDLLKKILELLVVMCH